MKARKRFNGVCFALSVVLAASAAPVLAQDAGSVDSAIQAAKQAQNMANSVGFEWRDTGKLIKQAEKALAKAKSLADRARQQAEHALAQAKAQADAGPRFDDIVETIRRTRYEIAAADAARKDAASLGFEWRDTGKLIKKAKEAEANFEFEKALKLAVRAKRQGESAQAQALAQQHAGPRF